MKKNEYPTCILFDNYDAENFGTKEDFEDFCLANEIEYDPNDNNAYYEYLSDMEQMDWDDLRANLRNYANDYFVIEGSYWSRYGLGSGEHLPKVVCGLWESIQKCIHNCDYIKIELEKGCLKVTSTHHDGTLYNTIQPLSAKGSHLSEGDYEEFKDYWKKKFHGYLY